MEVFVMTINELNEYLISTPFPPTLQFKIGMWYKSRGLHTEALDSLKKALHKSTHEFKGKFPTDVFDKSLVWLEYGKINKIVGNNTEAILAFQQCLLSGQFKLEGLMEWGDLLHGLGKQDNEIASILYKKCSSNKLNTKLLANALFRLGCYKEASKLYSSSNTPLHKIEYIQYVQCCLHTGEFLEAIHLLENRIEELRHVEVKHGAFSYSVEVLFNLCQWLTDDRLSFHYTASERLDMAKLAICHSLPDKSLCIVSEPNEDELHQLIHLLYTEGYRRKALDLLSTTHQLSMNTKDTISLDIWFVIGEMLYDDGQFQLAADYFEQIYINNPSHTSAQFATAACYLAKSLESLLDRKNHLAEVEDSAKLLEQYIHNVYQSLHLIQDTQWHTVWNPAQMRRISADALIGPISFPHFRQG